MSERAEEEEERENVGGEEEKKKLFSAVSVNKYIEITTEAVVASAKRKRKCRDGGGEKEEGKG